VSHTSGFTGGYSYTATFVARGPHGTAKEKKELIRTIRNAGGVSSILAIEIENLSVHRRCSMIIKFLVFMELLRGKIFLMMAGFYH